MVDWRHGLVAGSVAAVGVLGAVLWASGFRVYQILLVSALVLVPLAVTLGAFLLVWRFVWGLDGDGRKRQH